VTNIFISSIDQLKPVQDFNQKMALYKDGGADVPSAALLTGDDMKDGKPFKVMLVPAGTENPPTDKFTVTETITTQRDLDELEDFAIAMEMGGDMEGVTACNFGNVSLKVNPALLEKQTEAESAQQAN